MGGATGGGRGGREEVGGREEQAPPLRGKQKRGKIKTRENETGGASPSPTRKTRREKKQKNGGK